MAGPNELMTKTFVAGGAIVKHRIVKFSAEDTVVAAAAVADALVGVALHDAASGERVEVQVAGIAEIESSASLSAGAKVTTAAAGKAKGGTPATANQQAIGIAYADAVADQIFPVLIAPHEFDVA